MILIGTVPQLEQEAVRAEGSIADKRCTHCAMYKLYHFYALRVRGYLPSRPYRCALQALFTPSHSLRSYYNHNFDPIANSTHRQKFHATPMKRFDTSFIGGATFQP